MKLSEIFKCARPVLFENDDPLYPYSIGGTAFVVLFKSNHYVVTAKHVLNQQSFLPDQFRIQYHPDKKDFIPLQTLRFLNSINLEDTDHADLAIFVASESLLDRKLFGEHQPYNLLEIDHLTIYNPNATFAYRGFPTETKTIDYDENHIYQTAIFGEASYLGPTNRMGVHKLQLYNLDSLNSIDGLSGSPVFQINHDDEVYSRAAFAGMIIQGSKQSGLAYFLEHKRIIDVLARFDEENEATQS